MISLHTERFAHTQGLMPNPVTLVRKFFVCSRDPPLDLGIVLFRHPSRCVDS